MSEILLERTDEPEDELETADGRFFIPNFHGRLSTREFYIESECFCAGYEGLLLSGVSRVFQKSTQTESGMLAGPATTLVFDAQAGDQNRYRWELIQTHDYGRSIQQLTSTPRDMTLDTYNFDEQGRLKDREFSDKGIAIIGAAQHILHLIGSDEFKIEAEDLLHQGEKATVQRDQFENLGIVAVNYETEVDGQRQNIQLYTKLVSVAYDNELKRLNEHAKQIGFTPASFYIPPESR